MFGLSGKESYGLQILDRQIRIVKLGLSGRALKMKQNHAEPVPAGAIQSGRIVDEEAAAQAIGRAVETLGIAGAGVHLSVPTSSTLLRKSVFPVLKDKELRNMIDVELNSSEQMPFKDPVFDFFRLGIVKAEPADVKAKDGKTKNRPMEEVLVFASSAAVVESYVGVVQAAGLKPLSVELASLASLRLLLQYSGIVNKQLPDRFLVINADAAHLEFSIFSGGVPVFLHDVPDAGGAESYEESAVTELNRIMYYFTYSISPNQEPVQEIYWLGDNEESQQLTRRIKSVYDGPIRTIPLEGWFKEDNVSLQSFAVPIGLALKGA
ncbi:type IV pilus biogenesis protein PilM [Paenibacillus cymbidii]|uniref:type IV pilus biogenesis protein PilM n=1 Tax=Paenibacillus cymbidii TaxID=1639034 RepID=UPI0010810FFB|nr:pilus assembly protein PilM [Paenibacillus cymbidii]